MGQQNVYVCKIKKNKTLAPPSETYFLSCFETKQAFPKIKYFFKNRLEKLEANCYRNEKNLLVFRKNIPKNFSKTTLLKLGIELKVRPLQCLITLLI